MEILALLIIWLAMFKIIYFYDLVGLHINVRTESNKVYCSSKQPMILENMCVKDMMLEHQDLCLIFIVSKYLMVQFL